MKYQIEFEKCSSWDPDTQSYRSGQMLRKKYRYLCLYDLFEDLMGDLHDDFINSDGFEIVKIYEKGDKKYGVKGKAIPCNLSETDD